MPRRVLADVGFANGDAVAGLQRHGIDPLVAVYGHPGNSVTMPQTQMTTSKPARP